MGLFPDKKLVGVKRLSGECSRNLRAGMREDKLSTAERDGQMGKKTPLAGKNCKGWER